MKAYQGLETHDKPDRKLQTQIALLEQSNTYTHKSLERIENSIDQITQQVQTIENKIDTTTKWLINLALTAVFSGSSLVITIYQIFKNQ